MAVAGYESCEGKWILTHSEYPLEVCSLPGRGRCVIASKDYHRGDVILMEEPYAMVIHHYLQATCATCGTTPNSGQIFGISPDDPQRYCSQQCLTNDSRIHTAEAQAMKLSRELGVDGGLDACNLLIRIAAVRKFESSSENSRPKSFPLLGRSNLFSHVMSLEPASLSLSEESIRDIRRVAVAMSELLLSCELEMTVEEAYQLLLIIQCNAHRIKDGSGDVALGLFPLTSMLNHSCAPNCFHSYLINSASEPPSLVIRALCDIKQGEELCYNYIPLYQSTDIRQGQLYRAYSFTCQCLRCQYNNLTLALDRSTEGSYPLDDVISLPTNSPTAGVSPFECSTEVLTCHSLLSRAIDAKNNSAIQSIIKKLTALCANEKKMSIFHPSNEILLTTYQTISKGCRFLFSREEEQPTGKEGETKGVDHLLLEQKNCLTAIGFTCLALGSVLKFTKVRNDETSELEGLIGSTLHRLHGVVDRLQDPGLCSSLSPEQISLNEKLSELFRLSSRGSSFTCGEFLDLMTVMVLLCLNHCQYAWETDPRVTDLVYVASQYPSQCYRDQQPQPQSQPLSQAFILSSKASKFESLRPSSRQKEGTN
jgi:hypothetical protein